MWDEIGAQSLSWLFRGMDSIVSHYTLELTTSMKVHITIVAVDASRARNNVAVPPSYMSTWLIVRQPGAAE